MQLEVNVSFDDDNLHILFTSDTQGNVGTTSDNFEHQLELTSLQFHSCTPGRQAAKSTQWVQFEVTMAFNNVNWGLLVNTDTQVNA